jgi:hypothetical protein
VKTTVPGTNSRLRFFAALPLLLTLCGCGTIFLDKFDSGAVGHPPAPPAKGASTSSPANVVIAANPQNSGSQDRWLRLSRTVATQGGGQYTGTFTQNLINKKGSVNLVGFIPQSSKIMMSVFLESGPPPNAPLLHIDLLPNGKIRINDNQVVGDFKFNHLIGFFINIDPTGELPNAEILIRGGGNDAALTVPISPPNSAKFGFGQIRILAPFEGENAPNGAFFVNDIIATTPN